MMPIELATDRPAGSDTAIIFAGDGSYARFALHAAAQIHALSPRLPFDICLAGNEMPSAPPAGLADLNLRRCAITTGGMFDGLRLDPGRSEIVYLRLALPAAFAAQYRRILYLDSDIFVESGDFSGLLDAEIGDRPIAAVRDNSQWRTPRRRPKQFRRLGLPGAPYFNAGVMLIDVARWLEQDITARAVALGRANRARMIRHDQNLLNAVLRGDWAELHPTWNWQFTHATDILAGFRSPNLIHFIGPRKPWGGKGGRVAPRYRRSFARFMAAHYPDEPRLEEVEPPGRDWMRKSIWRHFLSLERSMRYLDRFDHDHDVLT